MSGALDGVKVLDLTRVLAGPYCGMLLADMGAEVLKIEMPGKGDDARANPPIVRGESAYFMNLNRNKKGMTLNLKSEAGKHIFLELVKKSDIVIENFRPGVMDHLGLGYEALKKVNPAIVYGCVSGFGQYGPYSKRAGYDIVGQAMSGMMSTTGWPDSPPTRAGTAISDVMGGVSCCVGILGAYVNRLKTGVGDMVDVALVDSMVSAMEIINMIYLCTGRVPQRIGNRYEAVYPYDSFKTSDGDVIIACGNDKLYSSLCELLGWEELRDEKYSSNVLRIENHETLKALMERWTTAHTSDEIVEALMGAGIPAAPIYTVEQVTKDPHIAGAREMFVPCEHPIAGKLTITNSHLKFTNNKTSIRRPAPTLGQHTEEIVTGLLGISHDQFDEWKQEGVF